MFLLFRQIKKPAIINIAGVIAVFNYLIAFVTKSIIIIIAFLLIVNSYFYF